MAGVDYTTVGMIADIKRLGVLPDAQSLFTNSDMVRIMTNELRAVVVPLIMELKQEYLVSVYDQALTAGQTAAFIPERAVGLKVRDVCFVDSGGQEIPLRRYEPEDLKEGWQVASMRGFYVDNDRIIFLPAGQDVSIYSVRFRVFRRPNELVLSSQAARITAINTATRVVTCASIPSAFTASLVYDFIKGKPSFRAHAEDQVVSSILGFDITFASALPSDLAVGDWVAEAGFSPVAQIPVDVHPLLEQRAVIKMLEGLKDKTGLELAKNSYDSMVETFTKLVNPRVDGSPQKIVSRRGIGAYNRSSPGWR